MNVVKDVPSSVPMDKNKDETFVACRLQLLTVAVLLGERRICQIPSVNRVLVETLIHLPTESITVISIDNDEQCPGLVLVLFCC